MSRGKLKPEDEKCIQVNYLYLLENLDATHIVSHLYQYGVITHDEMKKIKSGLLRKDRNELLLRLLLMSRQGESSYYFLKSLEKGFTEILQHMKRTAKEHKNTESLKEENKQLRGQLAKEHKNTKSLKEENTQLREQLDSRYDSVLKEQVEQMNRKLQEMYLTNEEKFLSLSKKSEENAKRIQNMEEKANRKEMDQICKHCKNCNQTMEVKLVQIEREIRDVKSELQLQIDTIRNETYQNELKVEKSVEKVKEINTMRALYDKLNLLVQEKLKEQDELIKIMDENQQEKVVNLSNKFKWIEKNINYLTNIVDLSKKEILDMTLKFTKLKEANDSLNTKQKETNFDLQNKFSVLDKMMMSSQSEVENISKTISNFNSKAKKTGFNVKVSPDVIIDLKQNAILKCFNHVIDDFGGNYDKTTGIFTAPVDGLYVFGLFVTKKNERVIRIQITVRDLSAKELNRSRVFCQSKTSCGSVVVPLSLSRSEQVYLRSGGQYSKLHLTNDSFYVGVLIAEC